MAIRFGTVGDIALDVENQGEVAAQMALRILSGEDPDKLPVRRTPLVYPVFDYQGKTAILTILRNINERNRNQRYLEESLRKNVLLLRQVHRRVKNNLQIIISLLSL